jgi:manganese transport protein
MSMVIMACGAFHSGHQEVADIGIAYRTMTPLLGSMAAGLFLTALMASGISSSVVGTMAGQMIMQDFLGVSVPLWLRRVVTMAPSFIVVALGLGATRALVLSQVVLSLAVPVPMLALIGFASSRRVMGDYRLGLGMRTAAIAVFLVVVVMNALLLTQAWPF